jgi:hypothetical protein
LLFLADEKAEPCRARVCEQLPRISGCFRHVAPEQVTTVFIRFLDARTALLAPVHHISEMGTDLPVNTNGRPGVKIRAAPPITIHIPYMSLRNQLCRNSTSAVQVSARSSLL